MSDEQPQRTEIGYANRNPLIFDHSAASSFADICQRASRELKFLLPDLRRTADEALKDFRGYFAEVYRRNMEIAVEGGNAIISYLEQLERSINQINRSAYDERRNRQKAREYEDDWWGLHKSWDEFWGFAPPVDEIIPPNVHIEVVRQPSREFPRIGENTEQGMSVSSLRPSRLMISAMQTESLVSGLSYFPNKIREKAAEFSAGSQWGSVDCEDFIKAFETWNEENRQDHRWANTIANEFKKAGAAGEFVTLSDAALQNSLDLKGIRSNRADLTIPAPMVTGKTPSSGYANDPVNVATGNFIEPEIDLEYSGLASSCALTRMYNSVALLDDSMDTGVFGPGWSSNLDVKLFFEDEGATRILPDGRHIFYARQGEGFARAQREAQWLERISLEEHHDIDSTLEFILNTTEQHVGVLYCAQDNQGTRTYFSPSGTWLGATTGPGTTIAALRNSEGQIVQLIHELGRHIEIQYRDGRVSYVTTSTGEHAEYMYGGLAERTAGHLTGVNTARGTRTYEHDKNNLIYRVIAADGTVEVTNSYDERARIIQQLTHYGRTVRYSYLNHGITDIANTDGTDANVWVSDEYGRLVALHDAEGGRTTFSYDTFGNRRLVTERDGSRIHRYYDERGRQIREITAEGAETLTTYDEFDRVTSQIISTFEVDQRKRYETYIACMNGEGTEENTPQILATQTFTYASPEDRYPSAVTDAQGNTTTFTWKQGMLIRTENPEGVGVNFTYDKFGQPVTMSNDLGETTRLEYTPSGQLAAVTTPLGYRTTLTYDDAGNLSCYEDPTGALWKFEYAEGARLTAAVDPLGARQEYTYGASGDVVQLRDALERITTRTFDLYGNMSSETLPGGRTFTYIYDGLARLVETVDPAGGSWKRAYDAASMLTSTIDPTGVQVKNIANRTHRTVTQRDGSGTATRVKLDQLGRPVAREEIPSPTETVQERAASGEERIVYDAVGNPVEILDAEGGLTRYEYNRAHQLVREVSPAGRVKTYAYDRAGRLASMTDGNGNTTELEYDADSRPIARKFADGTVERMTYDRASRIISVVGGSQLPTHYTYDAAGRVTSIRDGKYGTRSFVYDAAGQVITMINGVGGRTHYTYDEAGNVASMMDPAGAITSYEYDVLGNMVRRVDPVGAVTEYSYDGASRLVSKTNPDRRVHAWEHDANGEVTAYRVDGELMAQIARNLRGRSITVRDWTAVGGKNSGQKPWVTRTHRDRLDRVVSVRHGIGESVLSSETSVADISQTFLSEGTYELVYIYDADGYRTGLISPYGMQSYTYDNAGNLVSTGDYLQGETASFAYDAVNNLVRARVGDIVRRWNYTDGLITEYSEESASSGDVYSHAQIMRDSEGRIIGVDSPAGLVMYSYDGSGQLVSARRGNEYMTWNWGSAGTLEREVYAFVEPENAENPGLLQVVSARVRLFTYDAAAQLHNVCTYTLDVSSDEIVHADEFLKQHGLEHPQAFTLDALPLDNTPTEPIELSLSQVRVFTYDANGHRTGERTSDGSQIDVDFNPSGYLAAVSRANAAAAEGTISAAASYEGEIYQVTGADGVSVPVVWDDLLDVPALMGVGSAPAAKLPEGIADSAPGVSLPQDREFSIPMLAPGTGLLDPFSAYSPQSSAPSPAQTSMMPDVLSLISVPRAGGIGIAGVNVLGHRMVDGSTASFLSRDPLPAVPGTGWVGNEYSLVGNNPVGLIDPWGLSPVSVEELKKLREIHSGWNYFQTWWKQTLLEAALKWDGIVSDIKSRMTLGLITYTIWSVGIGNDFLHILEKALLTVFKFLLMPVDWIYKASNGLRSFNIDTINNIMYMKGYIDGFVGQFTMDLSQNGRKLPLLIMLWRAGRAGEEEGRRQPKIQLQDNKNHPDIKDLNVTEQNNKDGMPEISAAPKEPPTRLDEITTRMRQVDSADYVKELQKKDDRGYSGVQLDIYKNKEGKRVVYVYISGTDFDGKKGELGSIGSNLGTPGENTKDKIDDMSPYPRLVAEAMKKEGISSDDQVVLVGHSQGGAVAYNLANNEEFNNKYNVSNVVTYGAPLDNLQGQNKNLPHHFNLTQVENRYDPIPHATPYGMNLSGPEGNKITIESPLESLNPMQYHDMSVYDSATQAYVQSHQDAPQISVDSAGKKAETKLYTGTNTADEDSWSRGMNELSKGYDRYVGS